MEHAKSVRHINPLTPNDLFRGRPAPLTSKRCILCIYSTTIGTEYIKHGIYSPFISSSKCSLFHNSNVFGSGIIHILYTGCAKNKKNNSGAKRLSFYLVFSHWVTDFVEIRYKISADFVLHLMNVAKIRAGKAVLFLSSMNVAKIREEKTCF